NQSVVVGVVIQAPLSSGQGDVTVGVDVAEDGVAVVDRDSDITVAGAHPLQGNGAGLQHDVAIVAERVQGGGVQVQGGIGADAIRGAQGHVMAVHGAGTVGVDGAAGGQSDAMLTRAGHRAHAQVAAGVDGDVAIGGGGVVQPQVAG